MRRKKSVKKAKGPSAKEKSTVQGTDPLSRERSKGLE
jgi:hypothetical protein